jgi:lysozyme
MKKRTTSRRSPKKRSSTFWSKSVRFLAFLFCSFFIFGVGYHYRNNLAYYFGFKSDKVLHVEEFSEARNLSVLEKHAGKAIGFDVSEYQGKIRWSSVVAIEKRYPLRFTFIRATVGKDRLDRQFKRNWLGAKKSKLIRGAYHYYRPNENSVDQAVFFIKNVKLRKGDLPPVLDIERLPRNQSIQNLKLGLRRWLALVESHYKVKPIIYTGEKYYVDFLRDEFSDYLFWIANYNFHREKIKGDWLFWQFTEKGRIPGIKTNVDVNIYNGDIGQLRYITIE